MRPTDSADASRRVEARELLDRAPCPGEREAWAREQARPPAAAPKEPARAFVFRIGAEWLALPADSLSSASSPRAVRAIPHRRDGELAGLVNIDGELLPCVRLGRILGVEDSARDEPARRILVIATNDGRVAFVADQVHGPLDYDEAATIAAPSRPVCVRAIIPWGAKTVGLLDRVTLWPRLERSLA